MNAYDELLVLLVKNKIEFITVGGIACAFNGYVRTTDDVDILINRTDENIRNLIMVLSGYREGYAAELTTGDFPDEEGCIRLVEDFPIDIFTRISGKKYNDLKNDIRHYNIDSVSVPYLDKSRLIELKKSSLRPQDQMDVLRLSEIKN